MGAVRRDTCATTTDTSGLVALLPESNLGLTTKAFPTFVAYIPSNNAERIEFRLYEEETEAIEQGLGAIVGAPLVISETQPL